MRTRIVRVFSTLVAAAGLVTGLTASTVATAAASPAKPAASASPVVATSRHHVIAYVTVYNMMGAGENAVVPVDTVTGAVLKPVPLGKLVPWAIAVAPDGKLAYVAVAAWPTLAITVISTRSGAVVRTIPIPGPGGMVTVIGVTPNGKMLYVSFGSTVVPVRTADAKVFKPIATNVSVTGFVFTPDSRKLYVNSWNGKVVPISITTNTAGTPIALPAYEAGLAITPSGRTLYVASGNALTPISTATDKARTPIRFAEQVINVAISPNGRTAYVTNLGTYAGPGKLFPVDLATGKVRAPIALPGVSSWLTLTPNGKAVYVGEQLADTVTAIRASTRTVLREVKVGNMAGLAVTPDSRTVYALNGEMSLTPIRTDTNRAGAAIQLPGFPSAIAFFRR